MTRLAMLLLVVLSTACGGKQVKADADPANLDEPSAEELAEAPCGRGDWSTLPPGSEAPVE